MLTIKALIEGGGIRDYFYKHPPLFIIFSSLLSYPFGDNHHIVQWASVFFSTLSLIPLYLIINILFGRRVANLSLIVIAVLPVSIMYSTWVKQEAMLSFFFIWSLYLYMSGRSLASGALFGLGLLTKEFAVFLVPIIFGWELLKGWENRQSIKRLSLWLMTGGLISLCWYAFCANMSYEAIGEAIAGGNIYEFWWHYPWFYYLKNISYDVSIWLAPFFVVGLFSMKRRVDLLPLLWLLAFYLPLSAITVKAPWYIYLASPALSVIIALGLLKVYDAIVFKWMRHAALFVMVIIGLFNSFNFKADLYSDQILGNNRKATKDYNDKEYLGKGRELLSGSDKIAVLEYNPALQYYLAIEDERLFYLHGQFPALGMEQLARLAEKNKLGWFVIDAHSMNYLDRNLADLAYLWGEPFEVGDLKIFKVIQ